MLSPYQESHKQNQAEEEGDIDGQIDKELEEEARATELLRLVEEKVRPLLIQRHRIHEEATPLKSSLS